MKPVHGRTDLRITTFAANTKKLVPPPGHRLRLKWVFKSKLGLRNTQPTWSVEEDVDEIFFVVVKEKRRYR